MSDRLESEIRLLKEERAALLRVLDALLIQVEPLRYEQQQAIEEACREMRKWADAHNRTCGNSNEMWFYMTEYRRTLETALEPLKAAILEGNRVFDEVSKNAKAASDCQYCGADLGVFVVGDPTCDGCRKKIAEGQEGPPFSSDMIPW